MQKMMKHSVLAGLIAGVMLFPAAVQASTGLLSDADQSQLASWLQKGALQYSLLFSKGAGDTASQFHAAVDGKGPTITVMEASNASGQTWLVGGYNPQSWNSSGTLNMTFPEANRTAFLFNLSSKIQYTQLPMLDIPDDFGAVQTLNDPMHGPSFGAGPDLDIAYNLKSGSSAIISYCSDACNTAYISLLDGSSDSAITVGRMEVYSIAAVPEPEVWQLMVAGVAALALARSRRSRRG